VFLNKATWSTTRQPLNWLKWKCARAHCRRVLGDDVPIIKVRYRMALEGQRRRKAYFALRLADALDLVIPTPERVADGIP
jgi:translation elongation factor EF-Tu-like GTPase